MADDVVLEVEQHPSYTLIRASGYLDISTSPRLREKILGVASDAPSLLLLDLGSIEFLDSSALGVILNGWKLMQAEGGTLAVISPQARITKIFEITALNLSIHLYQSTDDALTDLAS